MRKAITFGISALLIACALMWTIFGVLGTDAHGYGPRIRILLFRCELHSIPADPRV
jgi:hypothetical protein